MLGYLLMHEWALDDQRIVVIKHGMRPMLFCGDQAYRLTEDEVMDELESENVT